LLQGQQPEPAKLFSLAYCCSDGSRCLAIESAVQHHRNRGAVRAYLRHYWSYWSGPSYIVDDERIGHLVEVYSAPGASVASINC
jgi:hypothetical protein